MGETQSQSTCNTNEDFAEESHWICSKIHGRITLPGPDLPLSNNFFYTEEELIKAKHASTHSKHKAKVKFIYLLRNCNFHSNRFLFFMVLRTGHAIDLK